MSQVQCVFGAAGLQHVTACSGLARVLKRINCLFL